MDEPYIDGLTAFLIVTDNWATKCPVLCGFNSPGMG